MKALHQAARHIAGAGFTLVLWTALNASAASAAPAPSASTRQSWRCVDASGHVGYSQSPCSGATPGTLLDVPDVRTASQRSQADANRVRDAKLARQLRRDRLRDDRQAQDKRAVSLSGDGKPHVIRATPNTHEPVPVSSVTKPIRLRKPARPSDRSAPASGQAALQG